MPIVFRRACALLIVVVMACAVARPVAAQTPPTLTFVMPYCSFDGEEAPDAPGELCCIRRASRM